jgi:hypothetical protein
MRKVGFAVLALPLMVALLTSVVFADPVAHWLIAGGGNPKSAEIVGFVKAEQCDGNLIVHYNTQNYNWCITETHLHVATSLEAIPQTKKGNPIPGHFDWAGYHDCAEMVTYRIPMEEGWTPGTELVIATHAVVRSECGCEEETAWGGCYFDNYLGFPGNNWATYFTYTVQSPE